MNQQYMNVNNNNNLKNQGKTNNNNTNKYEVKPLIKRNN